jgi:hypothetical protein
MLSFSSSHEFPAAKISLLPFSRFTLCSYIRSIKGDSNLWKEHFVACSNLIVCRASSVVGSSPTQNFFFLSLLAHHDMTRKIAFSLSGLLSGHYLHQELFEQIF